MVGEQNGFCLDFARVCVFVCVWGMGVVCECVYCCVCVCVCMGYGGGFWVCLLLCVCVCTKHSASHVSDLKCVTSHFKQWLNQHHLTCRGILIGP